MGGLVAHGGSGRDYVAMPAQRIEVHEPRPVAGEPDGVNAVAVTVHPDEQPELAVTFDYVSKPGELRGPFGLHIRPSSDLGIEEQQRLGVAFLRDLPLARWEKSARLTAQADPAHSPVWGWQDPAGSDDVMARAETAIRQLHPDVDRLSGKAGARRWEKLNRLAQVVIQHHAAQLSDAPDPVGSVADLRGVAAATVRSWLYRAKLEGITPETIASTVADRGNDSKR